MPLDLLIGYNLRRSLTAWCIIEPNITSTRRRNCARERTADLLALGGPCADRPSLIIAGVSVTVKRDLCREHLNKLTRRYGLPTLGPHNQEETDDLHRD
jgi:hypothetical protein